MGKKKKTTPQSKGSDERASMSASKLPLPTPSVRDVVTLRLASIKARNSGDSNTNKPTAWMHENDMGLIDVLVGEEVILLPRDEAGDEPTVSGAVVCQVEAAKTGSKTPLSPGYFQIGPSTVANVLCPQEEAVIEESPAANGPFTPSPVRQQPPTPSTPSPATPSPSRFSFKTGGGGDQLYSPASLKSPSPNKVASNTPKKSPAPSVWVVPLDSKLGRQIQARLLSEAEAIEMEITDESVDILGCENILKRIILAHIVGRYVQAQESVVISFRGRPLQLRVASLCTRKEDQQSTELAMENLTLDDAADAVDEDEDDPDAAMIARAVAAADCQLMKVTHSTEIHMTDKGKLSETPSTVDKEPEQHVAGLASTIEEIRSFLMTPLNHPELFQASLKPPRGILLYGSSGAGKTCLAKQLVVELQSKFHVELVNCVSLQSKTTIVGEAERELSHLFRRRNVDSKPILLVMDDVHLICSKRGGYSSGTDRLAATLLSLIDGIDSAENRIVVLAITSSPSSLDPALRRPGRLDTELEVPLPDEPSTRAEILRFHLKRLAVVFPSLADEQWRDLGKLAKGFNGADCMLAVKEAARYAILKHGPSSPPDGSPVVTTEDLQAAIRATKPSAIKSVTVEIPQVKWTDIGGMESVKRLLRDAIELPLIHGDAMARLGLPAPRGILLYGPPGCSKTLMARALATEGQMNFLAVKGPELLSRWLGQSERALKSLMRRARTASPSIVFFDEIDSIAVRRGSSDSASSSRLLSQLLTELDGVTHTASNGKKQRVVVVGATNRPDLLDPALTRPGRIDRMIYVGVPDLESRKQIFTISLRERACNEGIDIEALAQEEISGGYSGAEIVAICRDAALLALEEADDLMSEHLPVISMRHLLAAAKTTKRQITTDMLEFYANFTRSRDSFGTASFTLSDA